MVGRRAGGRRRRPSGSTRASRGARAHDGVVGVAHPGRARSGSARARARWPGLTTKSISAIRPSCDAARAAAGRLVRDQVALAEHHRLAVHAPDRLHHVHVLADDRVDRRRAREPARERALLRADRRDELGAPVDVHDHDARATAPRRRASRRIGPATPSSRSTDAAPPARSSRRCRRGTRSARPSPGASRSSGAPVRSATCRLPKHRRGAARGGSSRSRTGPRRANGSTPCCTRPSRPV